MRQNNDVPRTKRILKDLLDMQDGEADDTLVNGFPIKADWEETQPNRVQTFVLQGQWAKPIYDVTFIGGAVLDPPFNLADGCPVTWLATGQTFVCRRISADTDANTIIDVVALVILMSE